MKWGLLDDLTFVYTFPKDISMKVNIIARLEFELTYFEAADQPLHQEIPLYIYIFLYLYF